MTQSPSPSDAPWGTHRPRGWGAFWLAAARVFPRGWPWSRFALLARKLARIRVSGAVDTELWGWRLRLYPNRSVSEARVLFLPRFWDYAERMRLEEWMASDFTFVDVGANVGAYSFWVASLMGSGGRVLAVEPDPSLARQLRFNIAGNGLEDRMQVVEAAIGDSDGEGRLLVDERNSGENRLAEETDPESASVPVRLRRLGDVIREAGLERIDCLKVDVEGAEADVLTPFLLGEPESMWPRYLIVELKGHDPSSLERWLVEMGYQRVERTKLNGLFRLS